MWNKNIKIICSSTFTGNEISGGRQQPYKALLLVLGGEGES